MNIYYYLYQYFILRLIFNKYSTLAVLNSEKNKFYKIGKINVQNCYELFLLFKSNLFAIATSSTLLLN